jgi:hypothetical protein
VSAVQVEFLEDNQCRCLTDSGFTEADTVGDWKLSDDGSQIRFRIPVLGYSRRIETKGTITKVYWSNDEESTTRTSTTYSIPSGWLYAEAELSRGARGAVQWKEGLLKVEKKQGFAGSVLIPCGKFDAETQAT